MIDSQRHERQEVRLVRGQDVTLRWTLDRKRSISGWTVYFTVRTRIGKQVMLTKTITLTDTTYGVFSASVAKADTINLQLSDDLAPDEYLWDLTRTDSGSRVVLAKGALVLELESAAA